MHVFGKSEGKSGQRGSDAEATRRRGEQTVLIGHRGGAVQEAEKRRSAVAASCIQGAGRISSAY
jgi:hypothetical protein